MVGQTVEQLPLPGQIWERQDGDHAGYHLLVTKVNAYHVKGRTVGLRSMGPHRGNERQKVSVPISELQRHYALFRDTKRHGERHADVMARQRREKPTPKIPQDPKQAEQEIARIRAEGVPPPGTPERGRYLSLIARTNRRPAGSLDAIDLLAMRLYEESDVQVQDIVNALVIDQNRLRRAQRILKVPNRHNMRPWRPKAHILEGEELLFIDGEAMFGRDGLMRPVFTEPLAEAADAPLPEEAPPAETAPAEPTPTETPQSELNARGKPRLRAWKGRRPHLSLEEESEILRLYDDTTIPTSEILAAYNLASATLHGILDRHKAVHRSQRPGYKAGRPPKAQAGHFELVDGRQSWVPGAAPKSPKPPTPAVEAARTWVEQATRSLATDEAKSNVTALVVPQTTYSQTVQRAWAVSFTLVQTEVLAASSLDEAIRVMREKYGEHIDITSVTRNPRNPEA